MGRLANKNILITGGNSGIGLAAAQEFDREGARVAICGLNEGSLQAAKKTLGAGSLAVRADVSNLTDLDTMFATIRREFGHLDGVFVNAGYSEFLFFEEVTEQSFDKVIAVNFKGAYFTIQKALPLLRQGSSVVINASVGARKGWPTTSTVSTCKAAVVHLARILSAELVGRGIRVNTLHPGPTGVDVLAPRSSILPLERWSYLRGLFCLFLRRRVLELAPVLWRPSYLAPLPGGIDEASLARGRSGLRQRPRATARLQQGRDQG